MTHSFGSTYYGYLLIDARRVSSYHGCMRLWMSFMWALWMVGLVNGRCNECHMDDGLVQQFVVATVIWYMTLHVHIIMLGYCFWLVLCMIGTDFPVWDDYDEHKLPFKSNCPPTCTCRNPSMAIQWMFNALCMECFILELTQMSILGSNYGMIFLLFFECWISHGCYAVRNDVKGHAHVSLLFW